MTTRVSIVEDDKSFREHLAALIGGAPGFVCAGAHGSAEAALKHLSSDKPDIVLLDVELPGMSGLEYLRELKIRLPKIDVVMLTICDDSQTLFNALEAGATGYLQKPPASAAEILDALAEVRAGGSPMSSQIARLVVRSFHDRGRDRRELEQLTSREEEILRFVSQGYQTKEIADTLKLQSSTVATHLHNIYEKLHVHSRAAAASAYTRQTAR